MVTLQRMIVRLMTPNFGYFEIYDPAERSYIQLAIVRPRRKRTVNRMFISSIFAAYFILLVLFIMNRQFWQVEMMHTTLQYIAIGLVGLIAGVLLYKIYYQIKMGRKK